jgi:hypothetical protein
MFLATVLSYEPSSSQNTFRAKHLIIIIFISIFAPYHHPSIIPKGGLLLLCLFRGRPSSPVPVPFSFPPKRRGTGWMYE